MMGDEQGQVAVRPRNVRQRNPNASDISDTIIDVATRTRRDTGQSDRITANILEITDTIVLVRTAIDRSSPQSYLFTRDT